MSEDLIKRSDAIKALRLEYPMMPMFKSLREEWAIKTEGFRKAEEVIMRLPSADRPSAVDLSNVYSTAYKSGYEKGKADRPQGEWILLEPRYPIEQKVYWNKEQALADTKGNGAIERRKCSRCGYTKSFMCHMKDEQIKLWNFCPNCGARMKGADDE